MMDTATSTIPDLAKWLLHREADEVTSPDMHMRAVFRVCEKLRQPLSTFVGVAGYRSLLSRALALARSEATWLTAVQIGADGSLELSGEAATELDRDKSLQGGAALIEQLLGLLATLIGAALTIRLVRDVWPDAPAEGGVEGREEHI